MHITGGACDLVAKQPVPMATNQEEIGSGLGDSAGYGELDCNDNSPRLGAFIDNKVNIHVTFSKLVLCHCCFFVCDLRTEFSGLCFSMMTKVNNKDQFTLVCGDFTSFQFVLFFFCLLWPYENLTKKSIFFCVEVCLFFLFRCWRLFVGWDQKYVINWQLDDWVAF